MSSRSSTPLIGSYVHMPEKPREQHALLMLRKIASLVKPVMVKHGFTVGCLAEFYPVEHNLLGLNIDRGRKICIRLRQPYSENTFLQLEDCVYTMLHELTHNLHGPHDAVFHACLKGLEDEYLAARVAGYSGEGFLSHGDRLGSGRASNPPATVADARQRALAAAEKRAAAQKRRGRPTANTRRPGGGGNNNSSSSSSNNSSSSSSNSSGGGILAVLGQRIAGALVRIRAPKACGGETEGKDRGRLEEDAERTIRGGFRTQAEADEADEAAILRAAIELIMIAERQEEEERRRAWLLEKERERLQGGHPAVNNNIKKEAPALVPVSAAGSRHAPIFLEPPTWPQNQNRGTWTCGVCTLINPVSLQNCDACGIQRSGEEDVRMLDAPPAAWPSRSGGPRGSAAARQRERVRVLERARSVVAPLVPVVPVAPVVPVVPVPAVPAVPAREVWGLWDCTCCEASNDGMWPACATCGVVRVKVEA